MRRDNAHELFRIFGVLLNGGVDETLVVGMVEQTFEVPDNRAFQNAVHFGGQTLEEVFKPMEFHLSTPQQSRIARRGAVRKSFGNNGNYRGISSVGE